jgi:hypothetical protein
MEPVVDDARRTVRDAQLAHPAGQVVQLTVGEVLAPDLDHRRTGIERGPSEGDRVATRPGVGDDVQPADRHLLLPAPA